jgi:PAS domain S-box-containing protein
MEQALRHSEEKFAEIFYANPHPMIFVIPGTGAIIEVNKAFLQLSGLTKEYCTGKTITGLGLWTDERDRRAFIRAILEQDSVENFETRMLMKTDDVRNVILTMDTITISGGIFKIVAVKDITEMKKIQEHLMVTDRLASIGELAAGIAHEINNPLTSVIGFSEFLINEKNIPQNIREEINIINKEALRAGQVANHLLTFARGHQDMKTMVDINEIIEQVCTIRLHDQRVNSIEVIKNLEKKLPHIYGNDYQLQQVLFNNLINAE